MTKNELIDRLSRRLETSRGFKRLQYTDSAGKVRKVGIAVRREVISSVLEGIVDEVQDAVRDKVPVRLDGLISITPEERNQRVRNWESGTYEKRLVWFLKIRPAEKLVKILRGK